MGESMCYMRVRWATPQEAQKYIFKVREFLERVAACYNKWQEVRCKIPPKEGDSILRSEFPDVFDKLEIQKPTTSFELQSLNYLAGLLDSPAIDSNWKFKAGDCEVYCSGVVWHLATWEPLVRALKKYFGALEVSCSMSND